MSITETTRPTKPETSPNDEPSVGPDSLSGHAAVGTQTSTAIEGTTSPQATVEADSKLDSPAGSETSRSHPCSDAPTALAAADDFPGGQSCADPQCGLAAGDQVPPAATWSSPPKLQTLLADPLLALAADVLDDLEKVRIANENRLRQLTRSEEDSDGETRGFGLDEAHPDVARLAALVGMLAEAEHKATLNLQRVMRKHPLGPWLAAQKGIGEKQGARLLAAIGDPYVRPEIVREDGTVESSRPRKVSELWAYCGYHVVPVGQWLLDLQAGDAGGELNGSGPGHVANGTQGSFAGVAPKRQRGQHANWSATAKMRAFLIAEKCVQSGKGSNTTYYQVYAAARAKYADAVHAAECPRCGPKGKPAQPDTPLSDGHKHARALRAVAKEILKQLWREARRIHEETSAAQEPIGTQQLNGSGSDHPVAHLLADAQSPCGNGDMLPPPITRSTPSVASAAEQT
jgi:hypothetical protein